MTFKFTEISGQGLLEGDFPCPSSLEAGRCVLTNFADAILLCYSSGGLCQSATIYMNGRQPGSVGGCGVHLAAGMFALPRTPCGQTTPSVCTRLLQGRTPALPDQ